MRITPALVESGVFLQIFYLWDYASRWGCSMEELIQKNPHIRDICDLKEGERVVIP